MSYREPLPPECPPDEAEEIKTTRDVFRLVRTNPPTEKDFRSQRAEKPNRDFGDVSECLARGLSVFAEKCAAARVKNGARLKDHLVCRVTLTSGAGKIQQTLRKDHHTWWPLKAFDILANCDVESP